MPHLLALPVPNLLNLKAPAAKWENADALLSLQLASVAWKIPLWARGEATVVFVVISSGFCLVCALVLSTFFSAYVWCCVVGRCFGACSGTCTACQQLVFSPPSPRVMPPLRERHVEPTCRQKCTQWGLQYWLLHVLMHVIPHSSTYRVQKRNVSKSHAIIALRLRRRWTLPRWATSCRSEVQTSERTRSVSLFLFHEVQFLRKRATLF